MTTIIRVTSKSGEDEVTDWGLNGVYPGAFWLDPDYDGNGNFLIDINVEDDNPGVMAFIQRQLDAAPDVISYEIR